MASRTKAKKYRYADSVLEHLPIGVAVYEVQKFRLVEANALFLTNVEAFLDPCWQHGLMVGRTLAEFGAHLHSLCDIDIFRSVAESGNGYREDALPLSTPHGSISYWDWTLDLIPDADGEHHHLLQTMTDVTAQVQARREATRCGELLEQHKNEFLAIANHELRTPITIIQGFAELLKMTKAEEDTLSDFTRTSLTYIIDQSEHLARLIEAMLDVSKIDNDQFELKIESHDLLSLLVDIVKNQEIVTRNHRFRLSLDGLQEQDKVICLFDKQNITQALSNLINNAIKYSPNAGEIEVGLRIVEETPCEYKRAVIWVKDHGMGIALDDIPHIFERFYRASTLDGYLSGFGIGLYIVKEIITRHGGRVWVESVKGSGSTFYACLPLKAKQA